MCYYAYYVGVCPLVKAVDSVSSDFDRFSRLEFFQDFIDSDFKGHKKLFYSAMMKSWLKRRYIDEKKKKESCEAFF